MIVIPLTILALAAGVYLLIHVKQAGLGALYKYLAWLVVVLSFLFIICSVVRGARHARHMREYHMSGQNSWGRHSEGTCCPYMKGPGCCMQGGSDMGAPACSADKGGADGKAPCCTKGGSNTKPACCTKAAADSAAKK